MAISTNVAGRKIAASISTSGRPGRSASSAFSTLPRHLQRVPPREFFDDEQQAGPVVDDPVADHRLMIDHHLGHILQIQLLAIPDGHAACWPGRSGLTSSDR